MKNGANGGDLTSGTRHDIANAVASAEVKGPADLRSTPEASSAKWSAKSRGTKCSWIAVTGEALLPWRRLLKGLRRQAKHHAGLGAGALF